MIIGVPRDEFFPPVEVADGLVLDADQYCATASLLGCESLSDRARLATGLDYETYQRARSTAPRRPFAMLIIDHDCGSCCVHCSFGLRGVATHEIDFAEVRKVVLQLRAEGYVVFVYARDLFGEGAPFEQLLEAYRLTHTSMFTTRAERPFTEQDLLNLESASIRYIAFSLQPNAEAFRSLFVSNRFDAVLENVAFVARQRRTDGTPRFHTQAFMVVDRRGVEQMEQMASLAERLGLGGVRFVHLGPMGRAAGAPRDQLLHDTDMDRFLAELGRLRLLHHGSASSPRLELGLAGLSFGPNYWGKGAWKAQLSSGGFLYACPFVGAERNFSMVLPQRRAVVCHAMVGDDSTPPYAEMNDRCGTTIYRPALPQERAEHPTGLCVGCSTRGICGGGCPRNARETGWTVSGSQPLQQTLCATATLDAWNERILAERKSLRYR